MAAAVKSIKSTTQRCCCRCRRSFRACGGPRAPSDPSLSPRCPGLVPPANVVEAERDTWPEASNLKGGSMVVLVVVVVKSAKVLCVGAGGIGCELLKTLVCTGFRNIEVIDLDTIETSNLNRQFLFRKHHVGQSKANTAAQVVKGRFDVDFFRSFDLVLNGLDNLEARRHVNRLCLAAERPLVESGTAGYLGQVTVHLKGRTECFECQPKPTPKSYPICTLRNTPDRPIHTIVWAKDLLFNRLFGRPEAVSDLDDQAQREAGQHPTEAATAREAAPDGAAAAAAAAQPAEDPSFFLRREGEGSLEYAERVFRRVYDTDIEQLCGVKELWEKRPPPRPLRLSQLLPEADRAAVRGALDAAVGRAQSEGPGRQAISASRALGLNNASQKWTSAQNAAVLLLAIGMYHELRKDEVGSASFDKDDDLAVDFVTAASNLRSSCYGIPEQSLFDAKGMAGNIIHAIATTNAIISGLIVTEALKVLAGCLDAVRNTYLYEFPTGKRLLVVQQPDPPCKRCMTATLSSLLSGVIKKRLAVNTPNLLSGGFLYEEGEGLEQDEVEAYTALLPRTLAELPGGGLRHGSILTVQDQSQHFGVDVIVVHTADLREEDAPEGYLLEGDVPTAQQPQQQQAEAAVTAASAATGAAEADAKEAPSAKRRHVDVKEEDGVLVLDDEEEEQLGGSAAAGGVPESAAPSLRKTAVCVVSSHSFSRSIGYRFCSTHTPKLYTSSKGHGRKRPLESGNGEEEKEAVEPETKRAKVEAAIASTAPAPADDDDDVILIDDDD
ncbi:hypothetical protein VOLCADRAFT_104505 [Volvox carteri f. nagariensis]|uniref:SUMO-activating enzyme subunit n=1 Tax=Volvox carteri f. nagariensis TaxID=3068 RepID=D8TU26_VOLCA|nr:uncharacterized protein VOLCADRAFT_104505 [Volvox carteri f. nagariensis]EFJ49068.1 hypothetical protein VOLCADRAFT_104505 [Volvox carteri f. nagariensis]|eukprot:XP_002949965.1 hypothetical protein VOLCADRAFT_104505 [Volvox carteri f. nagariensis]